MINGIYCQIIMNDMNNRFKFRVWDKIKKRFYDGTGLNLNDYEEVYSDPAGIFFTALHLLQKDENQYVIQQYTGILDRNRKDICEGDIIKYYQDYTIGSTLKKDYKFFIAEIVFENCQFSILRRNVRFPEWLTTTSDKLHCDLSSHIEIIGNIFENKDLHTELLNKEQIY